MATYDKPSILRSLNQFYHSVDNEVAKLLQILPHSLSCMRGCFDCCVDNLTVFTIEAHNISVNYPRLLSKETPHPVGRCPFLNSAGVCRIYKYRPYVCRTQGLPLRWLTNTNTDSVFEYRDICPKNEKLVDLMELSPNQCWTIGKWEGKLAQLEEEFDGNTLPRLPLRDLFQLEQR